ncbi:hypothetical protein HZU77_006265 [Neisseriaceae bacterium TC5R-5]|nr:hypothetical protein [Neisseriaceae bacterium TC5R-5]
MSSQFMDMHPDEVAVWLEQLPYTNLPECALLLRQGLQSLAHAPLDGGLRFKLLRLYWPALDRYYPLLEQEVRQYGSVSSPKIRQLAILGVELFAYLFSAFKLALNERLAKPGLLDRDQPKVELLGYTMMAARQYLLVSQQNYYAMPPSFWQDCHLLYSFALSKGWQAECSSHDDSIAVMYQQILLLGLTSFNRIPVAAQDLAKQLIFDVAERIRLIPVTSLSANAYGYLLDLQADTPPQFLLISALNPVASCYLLELSGVVETLEKSISFLQTAQAPIQSTQLADELQLFSSLLQEWQQPKRRRHQREKVQQVMEVIITVPSIWFRLNGMNWQLPGVEVDELHLRSLPPPPPSMLVQINQSDSGFLLLGQPRGQSFLVGEVLLLTLPGKPEAAKLGIVRWIGLCANGKEMECGIEELADRPLPVLCRPANSPGEERFQYALHLPAQAKPSRLVMAGKPFAAARDLILHDGQQESRIRLSQLLQQSPLFQLMEYQMSE